MEALQFSPGTDIPLTLTLLAGFIFYYQLWVKSEQNETGVDFTPKLPQARFRTIIFFLSVLTMCWLAGLTVLVVVGFLFLVGVFVSIGVGSSIGGDFVLGAAAATLREWSFGFPNLVLSPKPREPSPLIQNELVGALGETTSQLRPTGYVKIGETELSAKSENGIVINTGISVVVADVRNGLVVVRPMKDAE